jgi:polar amino acid transport system permease protein
MVEFTAYDIFSNLILAMRWTIALSLMAFLGGGTVGLSLLIMRLTQRASLVAFVKIYVQVFQGTPLLMQLFLSYFGLALMGFKVSAWTSAFVALTLYTSAFLTEIWRGCVDAVPKGQWLAAKSVGMGFIDQLRTIILPQAFKISIPPTVGFLVQVVKATALASVIGFVELTKTGGMISNATLRPFAVYACVALLYFVLCYPISAYSRRLEAKFNATSH